MTRAGLLAEAVARLAAAGVPDPARDARLLLRAASGLGAGLSAALADPPGPGEAAVFARHVTARAARQPVSQILGRRAFWGRDFIVTPDVLDPRPETETLIEAALEMGPRARLLDLGTGSGALLLTLLAEWPEARGLGVDASGSALAVARRNAHLLGVAGRARLAEGDWLHGIEGVFDLILCNPPYIPSDVLDGLDPEPRLWEPRMALSPGTDGLAVYRTLACNLWSYLAEGGAALFETGFDQAGDVREIFLSSGSYEAKLRHDLNGVPRCVIVHR